MGAYFTKKELSLILLGMNLAFVADGERDQTSCALACKRMLREVVTRDTLEQQKDFEMAYAAVDGALDVIDKEILETKNIELAKLKAKPI